MLGYLKIAQDLEMFGVSYFPIVNSKGTEVKILCHHWIIERSLFHEIILLMGPLFQLLCGVDALGINYYDSNDKFNPKGSFPWSEISKVSHKNGTFKVTFRNDVR